MNDQETNVNPFEETVYNERPLDDKGRPVKPMIVFRAPTGRFARKLKRMQTVHTVGICPECGGTLVFKKDIPVTKAFSTKYIHNKWVCKKCHKIFGKEGANNA